MEQSLDKEVASSDLCIIGIGSEWNWVKKGINADKRYSQILEYCKNEGNQWLLPIVEYEFAYYNTDKKIEEAYKGLLKILGDKKYFLISDLVLQDALLYGFNPEKCVFPCGNMMFLQTSNGTDELISAQSCDEFMDIVESIHRIIVDLDGNIGLDSSFSKPFLHGKELYLNQKRTEYGKIVYNESAYISRWDEYMTYLSRSLNSKLLVLELGVGLEYPTVIRWPFEKVTFINKKAHLIRVHDKLYHHTPEIEGKTDSIQMNSVDYCLQESKGL